MHPFLQAILSALAGVAVLTGVSAGILTGIAAALVILAWLAAGSIFALPYLYLAGVGLEGFLPTMLIAPVVMIGLLALSQKSTSRSVSKVLGAYFALPIILNGAAQLFSWVDLGGMSAFLLSMRFSSLIILPLAVAMLLTLKRKLQGLKNRRAITVITRAPLLVS